MRTHWTPRELAAAYDAVQATKKPSPPLTFWQRIFGR